MTRLPQIGKVTRGLMGEIEVELKDEAGKSVITLFSDIRAGISWPIRALPGYIGILGLLMAAKVGAPKSLQLLFESEYQDSNALMKDAYNKAHDLRFQQFYTDCQTTDWTGFNMEFSRAIHNQLGARDIRLNHSYFGNDFRFGHSIINRYGQAGAFILPKTGLFVDQMRQMIPENLDIDRPELKFHAVNGFRYVLVAFDQAQKQAQRPKPQERDISPKGWA